MTVSPTRGLIRFQSVCRALAYPFLIAVALLVIRRVATAAAGGFWHPRSYGGLMIAAALSGLALALVRLGEGRFTSEEGKSVRRNARYAAGFWLAAFVAVSGVVLLFTVLQRIPDELETPWLKRAAPPNKPAACVEIKADAAGEPQNGSLGSGKKRRAAAAMEKTR